MSRRSRLVAAITRTFRCRPLPSAPTFWISPVSRNRSRRPCIRSVISPTSSRKAVPRCAVSSLPGLSRYAPVKLPLTCPNSSDSSRVSGSPAQLTGANTFWARGPREWTARATISLPDPLSPVMSTFASDRATRSTSSWRAIIAALRPMSWTCVFERIAEIGLTRAVSSTNMSFVLGSVRLKGGHYASPRHESFNQLPQIGTQPHERRTEAISRRAGGIGRHALNLHIRAERRPVEVQPQIAFRSGLYCLRRVQQHAGHADVQHTHVDAGWYCCQLPRGVVTRMPSPFLHRSPLRRLPRPPRQPSKPDAKRRFNHVVSLFVQGNRHNSADLCLPD